MLYEWLQATFIDSLFTEPVLCTSTKYFSVHTVQNGQLVHRDIQVIFAEFEKRCTGLQSTTASLTGNWSLELQCFRKWHIHISLLFFIRNIIAS